MRYVNVSQRVGRLLTLPAAFLLIAISTAQAQEIDTLALREFTSVLAHDTLEGRGTGTRGERVARAYIVSQLERIGIPAARPDGEYLQSVPLKEAEIDTAQTRLTVTRAGSTSSFRMPYDFTFDRLGEGSLQDLRGRAIFAGTAALAADALADHGPLSGQILVLIGGLGLEAESLIPDWIERGAEGVIVLVPEPSQYVQVARVRGTKRIYTAATVDEPFWQPELTILTAGPGLTSELLRDAPIAPNALNGEEPFVAIDLDREVEFSLHSTHRELDTANVAALLPGTDPELRDEAVVYTAHFDHLGIGPPDATGDSIYNGFADNAAGVAMLLAIGKALARDPPRRSVLFLFFTGEELGLLGSAYYAANPVVPLEKTTAVINLDAGAPAAPPRNWWLAGGGRSSLGELASRVAADRGLRAENSNASPNSDHWPFLRRGVPAIFLIPGEDWEGVTREEKEELHRRWDHYHLPGDQWHPDFPYAGLKRYAELALAIGRQAADEAEPPRSY